MRCHKIYACMNLWFRILTTAVHLYAMHGVFPTHFVACVFTWKVCLVFHVLLLELLDWTVEISRSLCSEWQWLRQPTSIPDNCSHLSMYLFVLNLITAPGLESPFIVFRLAVLAIEYLNVSVVLFDPLCSVSFLRKSLLPFWWLPSLLLFSLCNKELVTFGASLSHWKRIRKWFQSMQEMRVVSLPAVVCGNDFCG